MIHLGDCVAVMAGMDADSVDAVVTDPPYLLQFMGKSWDGPAQMSGHNDPTLAEGHGGKAHDHGVTGHWQPHWMQRWHEAWGREALRVTKPGGYLLAFGGTRTHHRLVCGLEDAGWIIRDELTWVYASGFPKGKANLKPAHEPIVLARKPGPLRPILSSRPATLNSLTATPASSSSPRQTAQTASRCCGASWKRYTATVKP